MAKRTKVTMFLGEDRSFVFTIMNAGETACLDITGWTLSFMVKRKADDPDADALITATTSGQISIAGTYHADPETNAQAATVTLFTGDTTSAPAMEAVYELKRTNLGFEAVLAYGPFLLKRGVHWT